MLVGGRAQMAPSRCADGVLDFLRDGQGKQRQEGTTPRTISRRPRRALFGERRGPAGRRGVSFRPSLTRSNTHRRFKRRREAAEEIGYVVENHYSEEENQRADRAGAISMARPLAWFVSAEREPRKPDEPSHPPDRPYLPRWPGSGWPAPHSLPAGEEDS